MPILAVFAVCAAITIFLLIRVYGDAERRKKRIMALRRMAKQMGLTFDREGDQSLLTTLGHFHLISQQRRKRIANINHGETERGEVAFFEFWYYTGISRNAPATSQSVAYFRSNTLNVPPFALRPERLAHKIASIAGYQDIDLRFHSEFSKKFLLVGEDEERIRTLFTDEVVSTIEERPDISIEANTNQLIVYRAGKLLKPPELTPFIEEASQIFQLFTS